MARRTTMLVLALFLSIPVLAGHAGAAVVQKKTLLYVSNGRAGDPTGTLSVIEADGGRLVASIPVPPPSDLALSPDGSLLFVSSSAGIFDPGTVVPIATATNKASTPIPVGVDPRALLFDQKGTRLFVADGAGGTIDIIDVTSRRVVKTVSTDFYPDALALTADGKTLYAARRNNNDLVRLDPVTGALIGSPIPVPGRPGTGPQSMVMGRNGTLYVDAGGEVARLNVATNRFGRSIEVLGDEHFGMALSPDGRQIAVTNLFNHSVQRIDTATGAADTPIPLSGEAYQVAFDPSGRARVVVARRADDAGFVHTVDLVTRSTGAPVPTRGTGSFTIAVLDGGQR